MCYVIRSCDSTVISIIKHTISQQYTVNDVVSFSPFLYQLAIFAFITLHLLSYALLLFYFSFSFFHVYFLLADVLRCDTLWTEIHKSGRNVARKSEMHTVTHGKTTLTGAWEEHTYIWQQAFSIFFSHCILHSMTNSERGREESRNDSLTELEY